MKMLSSFIHPHVFLNMYDSITFFSEIQKDILKTKMSKLLFYTMKVNSNHGCQAFWQADALTRRLDGHYRLSLVRPWDQGSEVNLHSIYSLASITLTPLKLTTIRLTGTIITALLLLQESRTLQQGG